MNSHFSLRQSHERSSRRTDGGTKLPRKPMSRSARLARAVNSGVEALENRWLLSQVAVFDNGSFVDTSNWSGAESDCIQACLLTNLGHTVSTFTDYSAAGWSAALAGKDALVIPEQERAAILPVLDDTAKAVIRNFVNGGGHMIVNGYTGHGVFEASPLINGIFGFSTSEWYAGQPSSTKNPASSGNFADDPATLPWNDGTSVIGNLPATATSIYDANGGGSTVALMPYGAGKIVFLGWDWFDSVPLGSQDGGWVQVLNSAVLPDEAPVADAGPQTGEYTAKSGLYGALTLDGSASIDPRHGTLNYAWDLDGDGVFGETGAAAARGMETGAHPVFHSGGLLAGNTYTVSLRVTNTAGLYDTDTATIRILSAPPAPIAPLDGFSLFTTRARAESGTDQPDGLVGSYFNQTLTANGDWLGAYTPAGTRTDAHLAFWDNGASWGKLSSVGLTAGTNGSDTDWANYAVQWDGYVKITAGGIALATRSDDASRIWIDRTGNDSFGDAGDELVQNDWGAARTATNGPPSAPLAPGVYRVRVQYYDKSVTGWNQMYLLSTMPDPMLYTDASASTRGLTGTYINANLRGYATQDDWRISQASKNPRSRVDTSIHFVGDANGSNWGDAAAKAALGLTGGTVDNWDGFSVQWDGIIHVSSDGTTLSIASDDSSRMWIDLDRNGVFDPSGPEFLDNTWGTGHATTTTPQTVELAAGDYPIRIQYEEGTGMAAMQLHANPAPIVRVAYIVPQDRTANPDAGRRLQEMVQFGSDWFKEQMVRNGYTAKSFRYETESDGVTPRIYTIPVPETSAYLRGDVWNRTRTAAQAAGVTVGLRGQVWLLVPEMHQQNADGTVSGRLSYWDVGGTGYEPGTAGVSSDFLAMMRSEYLTDNSRLLGQVVSGVGPYPLTAATLNGNPVTFSQAASMARGAALQVLVGAMGIPREIRNIANLYHTPIFGTPSGGERGWEYPAFYPSDDLWLSPGNAAALNASRLFNSWQVGMELNAPTVGTPTVATTPTNGQLQFTFTASDASGLLMAQLLKSDNSLVMEKALSGTSATVTLDNPYYTPGRAESYYLNVYDVFGNRTRLGINNVTPVAGTYNQAPQPFLYVTSSTVHAGEPVLLDASRSTDPNSGDAANFKYEWDLNGDGVFEIPQSSTKYYLTSFATPGQFVRVQVKVTDPAGASTVSEGIPLRVVEAAPPVPAPWSSATVGTPALPGSASFESGAFTIRSSGSDVWSNNDHFQYVHRPMGGDGMFTVRLLSQEATSGSAKAGIMIRESTANNAAYSFILAKPGSISQEFRTVNGGWSSSLTGALSGAAISGTSSPSWLRLVQRNGVITAYASLDGITYTQIGAAHPQSFGDGALVGLAVCGNSNSLIGSASFDNFTIDRSFLDMGGGASILAGSNFTRAGAWVDPAGAPATATVDYGDGSGEIPLPLGADGSFNLDHAYAAAGSYIITVTVNGGTTAVGKLAVKAVIDNAPVAEAGPPAGTTYTTNEGTALAISASGSSDADQATNTLVYEWDLDGDGVFGESSGTGAGRGNENAMNTNFINADGPGTYTVRLRVTDSQGISSYDTATITVLNVAPTASISGDTSGTEGVVVGLSSSVTDPGPGETFTRAWTITKDGQPYDGIADAIHFGFVPDDNGTYVATLTVTDDDGGVGIATRTITVNNSAPFVHTLASNLGTITEGDTLNLKSWYNDQGWLDYEDVTVNWGDGSSTALRLDPTINVNLLASATDPMEFTEPDTGETHYYFVAGGPRTSWEEVEAQAVLMGGHLARITTPEENEKVRSLISAKVGGAWCWIGLTDREAEGSYRWAGGESLGSYTNWASGQPDNYPTVGGEDYVMMSGSSGKWNDGSVTGHTTWVGVGVIELPFKRDAFLPAIRSSHKYLNDPAADATTYTITVTMTDKDGASSTRTTSVTVQNAAPVIDSMDITTPRPDGVVEGDTVTLNAAFSDAGILDTHTATVDWGDGSAPEAIVITETNGAGTIAATQHKFLDEGVYHIVLTVADADGGETTRTVDLTVANANPALTALSTSAPTVGSAATGQDVNLSGAFVDAGVLDQHTALVDWGDGSAEQSVTVAEAGGAGTLAASHAYAIGGIYEITLKLADGDGGQVLGSLQAFITGVGFRPGTGQLQVIGTSADDLVSVNRAEDGTYIVHAAFLPGGLATVPGSGVSSLLVALGDGNDQVNISGGILTPALLYGGAGNDHLNGGNGPNAIFGDEGDDMLIGGNDNDLLIGGNGADRIVANGGADQLVAGRDDRFVLSKYAAAAEFLFSARRFEATADTHDDGDIDVLTGSAGIDRFFASIGKVFGDVITDKAEELFVIG